MEEDMPEAYGYDIRRYTQWARANGRSALASDPANVVAFMYWMAEEGYKAATIARTVSSLGWANRRLGERPPSYHNIVREALADIRGTIGTKQRQVNALTYEELREVVAPFGAFLHDVRDRAILTLGWAGALKRGELSALNAEDVRVVGDVLRVKVPGNGTDDVRSHPWEPETCPMRAYEAWQRAARVVHGPLFVPIDKYGSFGEDRIQGKGIARMIKRRVEAAGLDPAVYSGESLRRGGERHKEQEAKAREVALWRQQRDKARKAAAEAAGGSHLKASGEAARLARTLSNLIAGSDDPAERERLRDAAGKLEAVRADMHDAAMRVEQ